MSIVTITDSNFYPILSIVARVGFEDSSYSVLEGSSVEVCIVVIDPPILARQVRLVVTIQEDTAVGMSVAHTA